MRAAAAAETGRGLAAEVIDLVEEVVLVVADAVVHPVALVGGTARIVKHRRLYVRRGEAEAVLCAKWGGREGHHFGWVRQARGRGMGEQDTDARLALCESNVI